MNQQLRPDIVALLHAGLSDRAIGRQLHCDPRTVSRTGREPVGNVLPACGLPGCVAPRCVADAAERERDRRALAVICGAA